MEVPACQPNHADTKHCLERRIDIQEQAGHFGTHPTLRGERGEGQPVANQPFHHGDVEAEGAAQLVRGDAGAQLLMIADEDKMAEAGGHGGEQVGL